MRNSDTLEFGPVTPRARLTSKHSDVSGNRNFFTFGIEIYSNVERNKFMNSPMYFCTSGNFVQIYMLNACIMEFYFGSKFRRTVDIV